MHRIEFMMHFVSIMFPLSTAVAGLFMEIYNPVELGIGCWIAAYPFGCQDDEGIECTRGENAQLMVMIFGASVTVFSAVVVIVSMIVLYLSVRRQTRLIEQRYAVVLAQNATTGRSKSRISQAGVQAGLYIGAYILTYMWVAITRTVENNGGNGSFFVVSLLSAIFYPLQGFWNFFIYMRPRYLDLRKKYSTESRSQLINRIFTDGGTGNNNGRRRYSTGFGSTTGQSGAMKPEAITTVATVEHLENEEPTASSPRLAAVGDSLDFPAETGDKNDVRNDESMKDVVAPNAESSVSDNP
jgi:hypothetical protein